MFLFREPGFEKFESCLAYINSNQDYYNQEIKKVNPNKSIDLVIVDACFPTRYQDQQKQVLLTSNYIVPGLLDSTKYEQFLTSWYGMYAGNVDITDVVPVKLFNCFINRMDPIRQSWLYQLIRRDIFDQGYVSFNMEISRHIHMGQYPVGTEPLVVFDHQFEQHLKIFQSEHDCIRSQVPYRNFDTENLNQIIMSSKFGIVLETYFDRNESITLSEKIFRHLKLPRPWILFSHQHAVKYLRDIGFDVLDDIVDHSYDSIEFSINRQAKLLDIAKELCKLEFNKQLLDRMNTAAVHNQQLLDTMFGTWQQDITTAFEHARDKCLAL